MNAQKDAMSFDVLPCNSIINNHCKYREFIESATLIILGQSPLPLSHKEKNNFLVPPGVQNIDNIQIVLLYMLNFINA